jgi:hypothetical protein
VHKKLLIVTFDARTFKFTVKKTVNPSTGKSSTIENEFSAHNWNARTLRHLKDIHALGEDRFNQLYDMALNSRRGRMRAVEPTLIDSDDDLHSDGTLRSEDNDEGDEETAHNENNILQGHDDSEFLFRSIEHRRLNFLRRFYPLQQCRQLEWF